MISLNDHFEPFRLDTIGHPDIVYADWTASGRAYRPIELTMLNEILPLVGNTHTHSTRTGSAMSAAYTNAKAVIKEQVHAGEDDILLFCGSGMTHAVNKLQRLLGLRRPEGSALTIRENTRPVVFVTHMEHHSNHISWLETIATVEIFICMEELSSLLLQYKSRKTKIAAVTACSNVTGIATDYNRIAAMLHEADGYCFVDFACAAPYVSIDMRSLDAIYFSGHKFLGGPGTPGVLIFKKELYRNHVPDQPGGGTVSYTNPWQQRTYLSSIEDREDGGTPAFLGAVRLAMCFQLKLAMGIDHMRQRELDIIRQVTERLSMIPQLQVLEPSGKKQLAIFSFIVPAVHHNLLVKILNDRYGIQSRGGCSCAGTYGHRLLQVDKPASLAILAEIKAGNLLGQTRLGALVVPSHHE